VVAVLGDHLGFHQIGTTLPGYQCCNMDSTES